MAKAQRKSAKKSSTAIAKARKAKIAGLDAERKAKDTAILITLKPIAKEINVLLVKAEQAAGKAADQRLAAALRLAEAKGICEKNKLAFKTWCESNVDRSYGDANKLAIAGATSHPEEAIAGLRLGDAARRQKSQAKLREQRPSGGTPTTAPAAPEKSDFQRATDSIAALDDKAALNLATDVAADKGMRVISKHDYSELKGLRETHQAAKKLSLDRVKHDFDSLVASEKMELVKYAAKKVGVEIVVPDFGDDQLPDNLNRNKGKKVRRGAKA